MLCRLVLLTFVCFLAQCSPIPPPQQIPSEPQAREATQIPAITPQEELDLFNAFLDRA
ncbi:MAG: hypothetical protein HY268_08765 [Deltaproteobacteria bacterium]|nr:hypothetical protein [Deltaproteobacteria bacterium]